MTRISGNMVRVSFGTGRVIEKKGLSGSGSNLQTLAYQASPLLSYSGFMTTMCHSLLWSILHCITTALNCITSSVIGHLELVLVAHALYCIVYASSVSCCPRLWNLNHGLFFKEWGMAIFCKRRYWKQSEMQHLWYRGGSQTEAVHLLPRGTSEEITMWKLLL